MLYKIEGYINTIFPKEQITEKFAKRVIWIKTQEQYNNDVELQFVNDKCQDLDDFKVGDYIEITFAVGGRVFSKDGNDKIFNTLTGVGIVKK